MALLNWRSFHPFCFSPSTRPHRVILLLRSRRTYSDERIQVLLGLRDRGTEHMLGSVFEVQQRRLCICCSVGYGPESEDLSRKQNGHLFKRPQQSMEVSSTSSITLMKKIVATGFKIMISTIVMLSLAIVGAPTFLSTRFGRCSVLGLTNMFIPGHVDVQSLSLGWTKPIYAERISLKGVDEKIVLSILKLQTQASLWSLVCGKSGLGDCSINHLRVDLQADVQSGISKLALATTIPVTRLSFSSNQGKSSVQPATRIPSSVDVALAITVKARGGDLNLIDGKMTVRDDVAATLGQRVFIDILLGSFAIGDDHNLRQANEKHLGAIPVKANMWSEGTQAEAMGLIHLKRKMVELLEPVKLEMDLSPAVAKLYLARINPLLGEVVGPAVQDEDMPDVVLCVTPQNMIFPTENYAIALEPMRAVLARGPLAGGILSLLSSEKEDVAKGRKEVNLQTSHIKAQVGMDGSVECSRIDFLIAGKVEVATWGAMNWKDETLKMIIAIPSTTISNLLGLKTSEGYYLKIPVGGTLERPHVDWRAAAVGVAQLSLKQHGGRFFKDLISFFDSEEAVPDSTGAIPWIPKS